MEPLKINLWLVGEVLCLVGCATTVFMSSAWGQMTLPITSVLFVGFAILCSVESEQSNAE